MVKSKLNRTLLFQGVIMTMCDFRTRHAQEVKVILEKNFPHKLYKSYIRNNVTLKEASSAGKSIFEYDPNSIGAFDYQNFVEEFLKDYEPALQKRAYYEERFRKLPMPEQEEIVQFARQNLSAYNRDRLNSSDEEPVLQETLLIERNKILEKLFPYRRQTKVEKDQ